MGIKLNLRKSLPPTRAQIMNMFDRGMTVTINRIPFRVYKVTNQGMEIRPVSQRTPVRKSNDE